MAEFKVGETAWVIPFKGGPIDDTRYCCTEVTIIAPLVPCSRAVGGLAYEVRLHDGQEFYATPKILRKPIPPEQLIERESTAQTVNPPL